MKARAFMQRKGHLLQREVEILDEVGLKKGGSLAFEVAHSKKLDWYEHEAIFLIVMTVEIIGLVLGFTNEKAKRDGKWRQKVIIQKISIKENPTLGLAYDKKSDQTKVVNPADDSGLNLLEIELALNQANEGRQRVLLKSEEEVVDQKQPTDTSDAVLYRQLDRLINILVKEDNDKYRGLATLAKAMKRHLHREQAKRLTLERQNQVLQEAITQLQDKQDKMNEELKELIENYIPDLSSELADES